MSLDNLKLKVADMAAPIGQSMQDSQRAILMRELPELKQLIVEKTLTTNNAEWLLKKYKDKKYMAFEILDMLEQARLTLPPGNLNLVKTTIEAMKAIHGDKIDIDINANVHVNQHRELITKEPQFIDAEIIKSKGD